MRKGEIASIAVPQQDVMLGVVKMKPETGLNRFSSSTGSTASTIDLPDMASSDSDTGSTTTPPNWLDNLGETMKDEIGSYPQMKLDLGNHPQIQNILSFQKILESDQDELLAACAAADALAWQRHIWQLQQQQMLWEIGEQSAYLMWGSSCMEMQPPAAGLDETGYPCGLNQVDNLGYPPGLEAHNVGRPVKRSKAVSKVVAKAAAAAKAASSSEKQEAQEDQPPGLENHDRTVVATKINRLGYGAKKMLMDHFAQFGNIDYIVVPDKIKRPTGAGAAPCLLEAQKTAGSGSSHQRPSGLGFIVMETEEEAQAIVEAGAVQLVCGRLINVRAFKQ